MTTRKSDPIKRIVTSKGEVRYRFIVDVGRKPDGRRDQRCSTFPTLREARAALAQTKADRSRGTLVKPTKVTFGELCQRWLDSRHDIREVSQQGYTYALKDARAQLGRTRVQDLNRSDIERTIRFLREDHGLSHRSVVYTLSTIKQVLAYGITEGVVSVNVAASVKAPRKQHGDTRPKTIWEPEELTRFRDVADRDELAAAWRLTLCGLRRSEVIGLSWDHVDLDRGEIVVAAGRVALAGGGRRTVTEEPKSSASHRTVRWRRYSRAPWRSSAR